MTARYIDYMLSNLIRTPAMITRNLYRLICTLLLVLVLVTSSQPASAETQLVLTGPAGSKRFGSAVATLPNGNIVVLDPYYSVSPSQPMGAVYLYNGSTGVLISTLTGSPGDLIGYSEDGPALQVLTNGNFVIGSMFWDNGPHVNAGAVTFCSGVTGCNGVVSSANSLVGSSRDENLGKFGAPTSYYNIAALPNGNYLVRNQYWDNGSAVDAGAVAFCDGNLGCTGELSSANALVGSTSYDQIGSSLSGMAVLSNGNYIVSSPTWNYGALSDVGAVTFCSGTVGCAGEISAANSLIGTSANNYVPSGVAMLANGDYVVASASWRSGLPGMTGAATYCSGTIGCAGPITLANSLTGAGVAERVVPLRDGGYAVVSSSWSGGIGAVSYCGQGGGCSGGVVTAANSLVGTSTTDRVGSGGVLPLDNGSYAVSSYQWDSAGRADVGAVTWCGGATGCTGVVSTTNSLIGSTAGDQVGWSMVGLSNGNMVVGAPLWDNGGLANAGAVTFCSGSTSCAGIVSAANSLVGTKAADYIGDMGIRALANGNYVIVSRQWDHDALADVGAITHCSGDTGCAGTISPSNSLIGTSSDGGVGYVGVLKSGNYLIINQSWDNGAVLNVGAVTFCAGGAGCVGTVTTNNSQIGVTAGDQIGSGYGLPLPDGNYFYRSPGWQSGGVLVGAATLCSGITGCDGPIDASNSVIGVDGDYALGAVYDPIRAQLVVGEPRNQRVVVFRYEPPTAAASANQLVQSHASVVLDSTGSSDPDAQLPLTYRWAQTGGPVVQLSDPEAAQPSFIAPAGPATLIFTLTVRDSFGLASRVPATVVVNVGIGTPPPSPSPSPSPSPQRSWSQFLPLT